MMKGVAITSTYCKRSLRTALTAGALELDFMTRTDGIPRPKGLYAQEL